MTTGEREWEVRPKLGRAKRRRGGRRGEKKKRDKNERGLGNLKKKRGGGDYAGSKSSCIMKPYFCSCGLGHSMNLLGLTHRSSQPSEEHTQ